MSQEVGDFVKEVIESKEVENKSKINNNISEEWSQNKTKIYKILLMAGVIGGSVLAYNWDSRANASNWNLTSLSINHIDKKMYDKSTILRDFFKLYEGKTNLNNVLFSQWDLEWLLLTYEKTKDLLWKSSREAVRLILKDMFISILKEWYEIESYKDLDKLRSNIMLFSRWEIEIEYSDNMPKDVEFEEKIIVKWNLSSWNILLIEQASKIDSVLEYFDTSDNVLKSDNVFALLDAYYKDLPTGISELSKQLNRANSETINNFISLSSTRLELKVLGWIMSRLYLEIDSLKKESKEDLLDLKDKHKIILKKNKKKHLEEIWEINKENSDKVISLEDEITILNIDNETNNIVLQKTKDKIKRVTTDFNEEIDKLNESKIELKISKINLKDEIKDLKDEIKDLKDKNKDLKGELSIQDKENSKLVRTIKLNNLKDFNRKKKHNKEIGSKELIIENNIILIETQSKRIKRLEQKIKK